MDTINETPFSDVYDRFLAKITDDMFLEMTELETYQQLEEMLISALPMFEFPRVKILDNYECQYMADVTEYEGADSNQETAIAYVWNAGKFFVKLSSEEINIIATYMVAEWVGRQLDNIEVTRQKYSGDDFKFTSQANHLSKLITLKKENETMGFHLQRLYKRRKADENGIMRSTFGEIIMEDD